MTTETHAHLPKQEAGSPRHQLMIRALLPERLWRGVIGDIVFWRRTGGFSGLGHSVLFTTQQRACRLFMKNRGDNSSLLTETRLRRCATLPSSLCCSQTHSGCDRRLFVRFGVLTMLNCCRTKPDPGPLKFPSSQNWSSSTSCRMSHLYNQ